MYYAKIIVRKKSISLSAQRRPSKLKRKRTCQTIRFQRSVYLWKQIEIMTIDIKPTKPKTKLYNKHEKNCIDWLFRVFVRSFVITFRLSMCLVPVAFGYGLWKKLKMIWYCMANVRLKFIRKQSNISNMVPTLVWCVCTYNQKQIKN